MNSQLLSRVAAFGMAVVMNVLIFSAIDELVGGDAHGAGIIASKPALVAASAPLAARG